MAKPQTSVKPRPGRIVTVFSIDCRFGLPLGQPYSLRVKGVESAIWLVREFSAMEFVDPSNQVMPSIGQDGSVPYQTSKPVVLPETKNVLFQAMTVRSRDKDLQSTEVLSGSSVLVIFDPLENAASLRTRLCTEIVIAVEGSEREWIQAPKDMLTSGTLTYGTSLCARTI